MIGFVRSGRVGVVGMVIAASACSANPSGPIGGAERNDQPNVAEVPPAAGPRYYRVTVASAAIASTRPDGSPWHTKAPERTWTLVGAVTGYIVGQPELGRAAGSLFDNPESTFGPAPFVTLSLNGKTYDTAALEPTFDPRWNENVILDLSGSQTSDPIVIMVRDGIDGAVVTQRMMSVSQFFSRHGHTLPMDNGVISLELTVEAVNPLVRDEVIAVESGRPVGIAFEGGDVVELVAHGEVCVRADRCVGPDGDPINETAMSLAEMEYPRPRGYRHNYDGFAWARHGSLVALVDDRPIVLGSSARLRIPRAGAMTLFVNDSDFGNNSGEFAVAIRVNAVLASER